jgi:hypothetical protein
MFIVAMLLLCEGVAQAQWSTVWQAGRPGRGWPVDGVGGGPDVDFVQETGTNPPPGNPNSPSVNQQADDDYYFAGTYPAPIGTVPDERAFERAFAGTDNDLRIHFNLPSTLNPGDRFRFSLEANNLDQGNAPTGARYGVEVLFNNTVIFPAFDIRPPDLNSIFTSPEFTAASVGAIGGPGADNVIYLRGLNHNAEGGGNWMGLDYHHLETIPIPEPSCLGLMVGGLIGIIPLLCYRRQSLKTSE